MSENENIQPSGAETPKDDAVTPNPTGGSAESMSSPLTEVPTTSYSAHENKLTGMNKKLNEARAEIHKLVIGQDKFIDLLFIAMLSEGHALVEGVPGIAKTLTSKLLAKVTSLDFSRIQFTPDLMPTDVIGTNVYMMKEAEFKFKKGPIFSQFVLIDEINRAPAKTQSALFEVMEETQVTVDGTTYPMKTPFMVLATQNPLEQEGTYKLPEAQMDRFLFRILLDYPSELEEIQMLDRFSGSVSSHDLSSINAVLSNKDIEEYRELVENVNVEPSLRKYIAQIIQLTRNHPDLYLGASPRASLAIMKTAKAVAAINGRDFVSPDDIQFVLYPVLNHRLALTPEREMEGVTLEDVLRDIIEKTETPR
ncbi:MAG: MoxR family ATPase [Bacteroidetes bacterium]|uniref:MoxR family ATPase n=1 Tax=Phaeocystidibacter marisrubri TaxID=1577780 RepID=A0A6L3ZIJ8_9FLAO|nr:MoxR family ATPase [Phaeocystidibacter marisrubri]KAB2817657.1 MoxR family ATPase [Phaeocystidibacter marisrubri]TNE29966.1 MAG: MoxR family ATPase [Bacteroidota bacterium]GGH74260.1 magnesium chelatase subunit I [Phaeocystidibacter marisrubri]